MSRTGRSAGASECATIGSQCPTDAKASITPSMVQISAYYGVDQANGSLGVTRIALPSRD